VRWSFYGGPVFQEREFEKSAPRQNTVVYKNSPRKDERVRGWRKSLLPFFGILVGLGFLLNLIFAAPTSAASSSYLNFQSRLLTNTGAVVADGNYNIEFKITNDPSSADGGTGACSGSCLWRETRQNSNSQGVRVVNGYLSVNLGSVNAFPAINWDQQLYLTMNIGGTGTGASPTYDGEMSPRITLTALPYAFTAGQLAQTSGANRGTLSFAGVTNNPNLLLPDVASGTVLVSTTGVQLQGSTPGTQQTGNFNISGTGILGSALIQSTSATEFQVQSASAADTLLTADSSNNKIVIGNATGTDANTTLLVVDSATADPAVGYNGAQYYNTTTNKFRCYISGVWADCDSSGSGATTVGALDGQPANANGAAIVSNTLYLQSADATHPGLVNTTAQTFAGAKSFQATSTTAFQIQNSGGSTTLLTADTSNMKIEVNGDLYAKGLNWTSRTAPGANAWASVTYGNGLFVAVTDGGSTSRIMTSPDGVNWTYRTAPNTNDWKAVTYGNGLFVAVSATGSGNRVMTSTDGITWTSRTSAANSSWISVTYGNGLFVAVSSNTGSTSNRVMTSPDGVNWTARSAAVDNQWNSVTYGNGLFVAVSSTGTNRVMTSSNGTSWSNPSSNIASLWNSVTYGNGLFVAVASSGTNLVMTSPDGSTWTARTSATNNEWHSVTYGNGLFVAVSDTVTVGTSSVMTSPDGSTWTTRTPSANSTDWNAITYANGMFVSVGSSGSTANAIMTSGRPELTTTSPNNIYQGGETVYGNSLFKSDANSTATFQIQNAAGASLLTVDTTNSQILVPGANIVQSPLSPVYRGGIDNTGKDISSLATVGNYVYTANVGAVGTCSSSDATGCELTIYDVSNPANPAYKGGADSTTGSGTDTFNGIVVAGKYAYIAKGPNGGTCNSTTRTGCEFQIYDISNPTSPTYVGGADTANSGTGTNWLNNLTVAGNYAYLAKETNNGTCSSTTRDGCEIMVFDITNPSNPVYVGGADAGITSVNMNNVRVYGRYLYAARNEGAGICSSANSQSCELQIFDISNPTTPVYVGGADDGYTGSGDGTHDVVVSGRYAYLTRVGTTGTCNSSTKTGCELQIYDISNPASPTYVGGADTYNSGSGTVAMRLSTVVGKYVYVSRAQDTNTCSDTTRDGCEIQVYDVSDPTAPIYKGGADAEDKYTNQVIISGHYAYVAREGGSGACTSSNSLKIGCELQIYDISGIEATAINSGSVYTGSLQVQDSATFENRISVTGNANFGQNVQISRNLGVNGYATFQNSTNSTAAFQVQNATGGNLFQIDTTNSVITLNGNNGAETQAWQTNTNSLPVARDSTAAVTANGYAYLIGGYNSSHVNVDSVLYAKLNSDGSTGAWSCQGTAVATSCGVGASNITNANALPAVRGDATAVIANGYIYVTGGTADAGTTAQTTVYSAKLNSDGTTGAWKTLTSTPLPQKRRDSSSITYNGYVYVIGGYNDTTTIRTTFYAKANADGTLGSWTCIGTSDCGTATASGSNDLASPIKAHSSVVVNGYVYLLGGDIGAAQKYVQFAKINPDGTIGGWQCQETSNCVNGFHVNNNATNNLHSGGMAFAANGYVYIAGGYNSTTIEYAKVNSDGTTGPWTVSSNGFPGGVDVGFSGKNGIMANGYMYMFGGIGISGTTQTNIYYTSTSRIKVAGSLDLTGVSGGDYNEASNGGSLTAGNTDVLGILSVRGQTRLNQGLVVNGALTSNGSALFQSSVDSTTAFQVQNAAGGNLVQVDTLNSNITINGNDSGIVQTWQAATGTSFAARDQYASAYANGYIYIIGGNNSTNTTNSVQYAKVSANGNVGNWSCQGTAVATSCGVGASNITNANALPGGRASASAAVYNGYIYVTGGSSANSNATAQSTVYYAKLNKDGSTGSWTTSANPINVGGAQPRWEHTSVVYNGYLYVIGGTDGSIKSDVYYSKLNADGSNGAWSATNVIGGTFQHSSVVANGYVYVLGSSTTTQYAKLNSDGTTGTWSTTTALPAARSFAGVGVANGYIYLYGGQNGAGTTIYANTYFAPLNADGTIGAWSCQGSGGDCTGTTPANSTALTGARSGINNNNLVINGYLYAVGGWNGTAQQSTVYYSSIARIKINGSLDLVGDNGENLAEGGTGGELTAGNTNIIGSLSVQGSATVGQGLNVGDNLAVGGSALFKNGIDSTTAFQVQNATGGNLFQIDTTNSVITLNGSNPGEPLTWATTTALTSGAAARDESAGVAYNGYVYVVGGENASDVIQNTVLYNKINADGTLGSAWSTTGTNIPSRESHAVVAANGYLYILGGSSLSSNNDVKSEVYYAKINSDGTVGAFNTTSSLPAARKYGSSVTLNGYIYYIGGDSSSTTTHTEVDDVYYAKLNADGTVGAWSLVSNATNGLPAARWGNKAVAANGYIYSVGGATGAATGWQNIYYARPSSNGDISSAFTDEATNPLPSAGGRFSGGVYIGNGYMYYAGGENAGVKSTVYYSQLNANGGLGSWTQQNTANDLPAARETYTYASTSDYFYAIGGYNSSAQTTAYYTSLPKIKLGTGLDLVGISGETLADSTGAGGSLTAGNTDIVGHLNVRGSSFFQQALSVNGNFNAGNDVLLNSNNGGQIQSWITGNNSGFAGRDSYASVIANGYVYIMGGINSSGTAQLTVQYSKLQANGNTGNWSTTTPLPANRVDASATFANGYIYVIGGNTNNNTSTGQTTVWYARVNSDGTLGSWNTSPNGLPLGRSLESLVTLNGYVYSVGGTDTTAGTPGKETTLFAKLNPDGSTGVWQTATLFSSVIPIATATVANGYIYATDGNLLYYAKPNLDGTISSWSGGGNMPSTRDGTSLEVVNGYLYAVGGNNSTTYYGNTSYAQLNSDGSTGSWYCQGSASDCTGATVVNNVALPATRAWMGRSSMVANGYIYIIGGANASGGQNTVYYTSTARTQIAGSLDLVGISGETLSDGTGAGGTLTAGNTNIVGALNVQGLSFFQNAVAINDNLNVGGDVLLNSNNIGAVQSWRTGNSTGFAARDTYASAVANGFIYVIGGNDNTGTPQSTVQYSKIDANGTLENWSTTTALPGPRSASSGAFYNGYIYVTGGHPSNTNNQALTSVIYAKVNPDGTLGSWATSPNQIPAARSGHTTVALNGYIYVIGGDNADGGSHQLTVYYAKLNADGTVGTWSSTTSMSASTYYPTGSTYNGYIYVAGGNGNVLSSAKPNADGTISSWGGPGLPSNRLAAGVAITNGNIYVLGGATVANSTASVASTVFANLDSSGNVGTWYCQGSTSDCSGATQVNTSGLPGIRGYSSTTPITANGYIYHIGGDDGSGSVQSTVYYTTTARTQINGSLDLVGSTGENLNDANSGGSLTAGNTHVIGDLNVQGNGRINKGLAVGGSLSVGGDLALSGSILSNVNVQNATNSNNALQVQNAAGGSIFDIGTLSLTNLITNSSFESSTSGWTGIAGGTTLSTSTTSPIDGTQTLQASTTAQSNRGAKYLYMFKPNTTYTFSVWAGVASGTPGAFFQLIHIENGSTLTSGCPTTQTLTTTMTKYTCTFTTGSTIVSGDGVGMRYTNATTAFNFLFDAAQLEVGSSNSTYNTDPTFNLVANPNIENNTDGWSKKGNSGVAISSSDDLAKFGSHSLKVTTTANANDGATYNFTPAPSSRYTLSFWGYATSTTGANISVGHRENTTTGDANCLTSQTITTTWTQYSCTFTTNATVNDTTPTIGVYIKQSNATARTFYIDGLTLVAGGVAQSYAVPAASLQADPLYSNIILNGGNSGEIGPWRTNANITGTALDEAGSVVANGYIYHLGGVISFAQQSVVQYAKLNADGSTGAWGTTTSLPVAAWSTATTTANGYIYILGGNIGNLATSSVYYAKLNTDGTIGSWTPTTSLPGTRGAGQSFVNNGYIYMIGGYDTPASTSAGDNNVWYAKLNADGTVGTWNTTSSLSNGRSEFRSVVANGYVYTLGGLDSGNNITAVNQYAKLNADGTVGTWNTTTSFPVERVDIGAATANGYVYVVGGTSNSSDLNTTIYAKLNPDGTIGAWTTSTSTLPAPAAGIGSGYYNGYLYVVDSSSVWYASTARIQVSGSLDLVGLSAQDINSTGAGGELTAGNTNVIGNLDVRGSTTIQQGLYVRGDFTNSGSALFRDATNSTTAFQVQAPGGANYILLDTVNNKLTLGSNATDKVSYSTHLSVAPNTSTSVVSGTMNVSGPNPVIIVNVGLSSATATVSSVSWSLGSGTAYEIKNVRAGTAFDSVWAIPAPTTGSGTYTVNFSTSVAYQVDAQVYNGADQTTPSPIADAVSTSGADVTSLNLTASNLSTNDAEVAAGVNSGAGGDPTGVTPTTVYLDATTAVNLQTGYRLGTGSVTATWNAPTSSNEDLIAVRIKAASSSSTNIQGGTGGILLNPEGASNTGVTIKPVNNSTTAFQIQNSAGSNLFSADTTNMKLTSNGDFVAANAATGTTATTSGTGTNTTTVTLTAGAFANGDVILIDNAGQDYFTRITSGGGTTSLTVNPAVTFEATRTVTKYNIQNIGATSTDYTTLANRFYQGYFLGGVVVGTGSTYLSDGNLKSTGTLTLTGTSVQLQNTSDSASSFNLQRTNGDVLLTSDTQNNKIVVGNSTGTNTNTTLFVIDSATADPTTGYAGAMYYNSTNNKYRCYTTVWVDCAGSGSTTTLSQIYDDGASSADQTLNLASGKGGGVIIKDYSGDTAAFQIQNSSSGSIFNVNTTNSVITLNGANSPTPAAWTSTTALTGALEEHATVYANGYVYAIAGVNSGFSTTNVVYYAKVNADGSIGSWSTGNSTGLSNRYRHAAVTANGYIYLLGGNVSGSTSTDVLYAKINADGNVSNWTATTSLTAAREDASAVTANGYIYVIGGGTPTAQSTVYYAKLKADGTIGSWNTGNSTGFMARTRAAATVANGYVYIVGGSTTQNTVYYAKLNADGTNGNWSTTNTLGTGVHDMDMVSLNGYLYVIAGNGSGAINTVQYAQLNSNGTTGTWGTTTNTNLTARTNHTTFVANGYMYAVGGVDSGGNVTASIYYTSLARTKISGSLDLTGGGAQNLVDGGNQGGSLTAGNTTILGSLGVQGGVSLQQGLYVGDTVTVGGSALFKNGSDSTTAYQFQNAAGTTLFGINTSSGILFSNIADGASAVGFTLNVNNTYSTNGAKLLSIQNNGTQKFAIDRNGHIISGGTSPSITEDGGGNMGSGGTCSISGNDTSGLITMVTGTGSVQGNLCDITFSTVYGSAPKVIVSPGNDNIPGIAPYVDSASVSTSGFSVGSGYTPSDGLTYKLYYYVIQ
jgi:hypothetical protein